MLPDPEKVKVKLGQRVRQLREQRGWSQVRMEVETGVPRNVTCDIERGARHIGVATLCRLAAAFRITLSDLLTGVDEPMPPSKSKAKRPTGKTR